MATRWFQDGGSATVHPADGHGFTRAEMQKYAGTDGGPVDIVYLSRGRREGAALIVDDRGPRVRGGGHGRRENAAATHMYQESGGAWPILGDALEARYEALGTEQERWW